jgi:thiol:disulfide interchange protein
MHILLININPVVSRLISLCMREEHIYLEEVHNVRDVTRDRYDIVFVDEASYVDEIRELLENLIMRKKVFLTSNDETIDENTLFDSTIKKPFLPSQITAVLESLEEDDTLELMTEIPSIFPLSSDEESVEDDEDDEKSTNEKVEEDETKATNVLDTNEIEKIKALLEMEEETEEVSEEEYESRKVEVIKQQLIADGLEIVDESEYVEALSKKPLTEKVQKRKKKKSVKSKKEEIFTFEEALIAAVEGMKVKKIKKLLKGAEVTIKINFKDKK